MVTDEPEKTPDVKFMYSKAIPIEPGLLAEASRLPSDKEIRVISTKEAKYLFGTGAQIMDGVTVCKMVPLFPQSDLSSSGWSMTLLNCT